AEVADSVELLRHAIGVVESERRDAPSTRGVPADDDRREPDQSRTDHRELGSLEVRQVERGRKPGRKMQIASQECPSATPRAGARERASARAAAAAEEPDDPRVDPAPERDLLLARDIDAVDVRRGDPAGALRSGGREDPREQELRGPYLETLRPADVDL